MLAADVKASKMEWFWLYIYQRTCNFQRQFECTCTWCYSWPHEFLLLLRIPLLSSCLLIPHHNMCTCTLAGKCPGKLARRWQCGPLHSWPALSVIASDQERWPGRGDHRDHCQHVQGPGHHEGELLWLGDRRDAQEIKLGQYWEILCIYLHF